MRPHEDALRRATNGQNPALVSMSDGRMVAQLRRDDVQDWEALLLAAPDMARALRMLLKNGHLQECPRGERDAVLCTDECRVVRATLDKAGVPLL